MTQTTWRSEKWAEDVPGPVMSETLDNVQADDKRPPTLAEAVSEARHVLSLYNEGGTQANGELTGEYGTPAKRAAQTEVRKCKAFIDKYSD